MFMTLNNKIVPRWPGFRLALAVAFLGFLVLPAEASLPLQPIGLRCEYLTNPMGIDVVQPRLSWVLTLAPSTALGRLFTHQNETRGRQQTAYRILVASSAEKLAANQGDLWDSGQMASDETAQIEYAGVALTSRQQCFWKVAVWDERASAVNVEPGGHLGNGTAPAAGLARILDWDQPAHPHQ